MLSLDNRSSLSAGLYPGWSLDRTFQWTCVVKSSYQFDLEGNLKQLEHPEPIVETDHHLGNPLKSSIEAASEIAPFKQGSEIYLYGTAHPPLPDTRLMEVALGIQFANNRKWEKTLRIFGRRCWKGTRFTPLISSPDPIGEPIPLIYEYAYGGVNPVDEEDVYLRNWVGQGYATEAAALIGKILPQIEGGPKYIKSPGARANPGGYGPLPSFWSPRVEDAGTLDETAATMGLCPFSADMKESFYNVAPIDQRFEERFTGREVILIRGLCNGVSPSKTIKIRLPEPRHQIFLITGGAQKRLEAVLDTVWLHTDSRTLHTLCRTSIPWRRTDTSRGWVVLQENMNAMDASLPPMETRI